MTNPDATAQLDAENPWPGLEAFQENARAFFRGRDKEAQDLLDRVLENPVTSIYGRSGLGKTSLLRAGLFPLLRENNCLPIYVRFTLKPGARPLDEQILDALRASVLSEVPNAVLPSDGESLWEYLHRKDFKLWSARNYPLTPVIVLDQFEELYTLGERVPELVEPFRNDLGNLAENRIPETLAARAQADDTIARRLQVRSHGYKLLISLREDFLPDLEGWRRLIPSLGRNRVRLQRLNSADAFDAVYTPAAHMMTEELAQRIVAIIAGGDLHRGNENQSVNGSPEGSPEGRLDEVEPPLLSLFCRELNEERKRRGQSHFDRQLVEESKGDILSNYYQSCVASMPDRVAEFIETKLITEKGFRCSVPRDEADLTEDELSQLIGLRLLRVEERYDTPCIELTHDVLTGVVREERAAREKADLLAATAEREAELEVEKKRTRTLRILVAVALVATVFAGFYWYRAQINLEKATALSLMAQAKSTLEEQNGKDQLSLMQLLIANSIATNGSDTALKQDSISALFNAAVARQDLVRVFSPPGAQMSPGTQMSISSVSSDGQYVVAATRPQNPPGSECKLQIVKLSTGVAIEPAITYSSRSCLFASSRDAKQAATLSDDNTIQRWDTAEGREIGSPIPFHAQVLFLAVSSDGRRMYAGLADGNFEILDFSTGRTSEGPFPIGRAEMSRIRMSRDERRLISFIDKEIRIWDVSTGLQIGKSITADSPIMDASISMDGRRVVGLGEKLMQVWETESQRTVQTLPLRDESIPAKTVALNSDGSRILTGGGINGVQLWDVAKGEQIGPPLQTGVAIRDLSFSESQDQFFISSSDGAVSVWQQNLGMQLPSGRYTSIAFSTDGKRVVTARPSGPSERVDFDRVQVWDVTEGKVTEDESIAGPMLNPKVKTVAFNRDGTRIISVGEDGTLRILEVATGNTIAELPSIDFSATSVAYSPDGSQVAAGGKDGRILILEADKLRPQGEPIPASNKSVTSLAYSADGDLIVSGSSDGTLRVWSASTHEAKGPQIQVEDADNGSVLSIAISDDGKLAVSGSKPLEPNGKRYDETGRVRIWNLETRTETRNPAEADVPIRDGARQHQFGVKSLAFSRDGNWIVSAGADSTIRLWSTKSGNEIGKPIGGPPVTGAIFSPDATRVIYGTETGAVRFIPGPQDLVGQLCAKLVSPISSDDWETLARGIDSSDVCPRPSAPLE